jgi:peptidoglycan/LPS O-acetylase OafA/YrhL
MTADNVALAVKTMSDDSIKSWEVQSSIGKHFDALDGIRGVAILLVVAFHTFYVNPASGKMLLAVDGLIKTGFIGVPIFFVLSGFLISYPFFRQRATDTQFWYFRGYTRRRIGKILPPYYLSIAVFAAYYFLRFSNPAYLRTALQWALGVLNFVPNALRFNASYWSLIVEIHFYVMLPFLFFLTRGLKVRHASAVLFFILFAVPLVVRELTWPEQALAKDQIGFLMSRFPCQLDFFAWGVLFSGVFVSLPVAPNDIRALGVFGYAGAVLFLSSICLWALWSNLFDIHFHPTRWSIEAFHFLSSASAFLLLFFVFDPRCFGARVLSHRALRFVGIVSYEWFLFHQPIVDLFQDLFGQAGGSLTRYLCRTVLPLTLTFACSVVVYRYFSLPLMNRIRGKRPGQALPP